MNKIHIILNNRLLTAIASAFLFLFPFHVVFIFFKNLFYDLGLIKATKINSRVISVGNVSLGGTGKTPTTIAIANFFQKNGFAVGIVSRGHGRKNESKSFLVEDQHWSECGDEVVLLKNNLGNFAEPIAHIFVLGFPALITFLLYKFLAFKKNSESFISN